MQTFLPYSDFQKTAKCLDYKRLGKQRVETWQIYNALEQGEYKKCFHCSGTGYDDNLQDFDVIGGYFDCKKCKGTGKVKTAWYNHPIVKMWKGYENTLLLYGVAICEEWIKRGYKDNMLGKFELALLHGKKEKLNIPKWLGNKKFHESHRSNLLRKDKEYYSQFGWEEPDNLPYVWVTEENKI